MGSDAFTMTDWSSPHSNSIEILARGSTAGIERTLGIVWFIPIIPAPPSSERPAPSSWSTWVYYRNFLIPSRPSSPWRVLPAGSSSRIAGLSTVSLGSLFEPLPRCQLRLQPWQPTGNKFELGVDILMSCAITLAGRTMLEGVLCLSIRSRQTAAMTLVVPVAFGAAYTFFPGVTIRTPPQNLPYPRTQWSHSVSVYSPTEWPIRASTLAFRFPTEAAKASLFWYPLLCPPVLPTTTICALRGSWAERKYRSWLDLRTSLREQGHK